MSRGRARGAAGGGLLGLAVVAAALAGPWHPLAHPDPALPPPPPLPPLPRPGELASGVRRAAAGSATGDGAGGWALAVLAVVAVVVVALLVRWCARPWVAALRRHRYPDGADGGAPGHGGVRPAGPDLPTLRAGVDDADTAVGADATPRDAIVAAWVALEHAAGRSGVPRDPAATPTEFTVAVLDRTPADRTATRTLLQLYLRARFGDAAPSPDDVAAARAALGELRRTLAGLSREPA